MTSLKRTIEVAVFALSATLATSLASSLSGCTNVPGQKQVTATASSTPSGSSKSGLGTSSASGINYTVTNATAAAGTSAVPIFTVYLSASNPNTVISNSCTGTQSPTNSLPCSCQFSWQEMNQTGATQVPIQHNAVTSVLSVQPTVVTCNAPAIYSTEIPTGTTVKISVVPSATNTSAFSSTAFSYVISTTVSSGSFQDVQGKSFDNIMRYSCYDTTTRNVSVHTKFHNVQNTATSQSVNLMLGSDFCAVGSPSADCPNQSSPQATGQSYYYNLFVRNSDVGNINTENTRYRCPLVKETLNSINTAGSQTNYYPLDTSFALALVAAPNYPVGVQAFTKVGIAGSQNSSCDGSASTASSTASLVQGCLGFAASPSTDGTCPLISLASGQSVNTYRLRRFIALYPPLYNADGKMIAEQQASDTIYVLDRPVTFAGANPAKPYTMRGPKPCPFAYFDSKAVTDTANDVVNYPAGTPAYAATNNTAWNGTNVDGTQFPNLDVAGQSCAATIPLLSPDRTTMSLATVHNSNPIFKHLYVRPIQAWAPHYEEDTDFQACAPQAAPFIKDPPLHFSKDISTGNVNWCAEAYPTQNPNVTLLDVKNTSTGKFPEKVMTFTSHVTKNSLSPVCTATQIPLTAAQLALYPSNPGTNSCQTGASTTIGTAFHPGNMLMDTALLNSSLNCGTGTKDTTTPTQCNFCTNQTCDRTVENNDATLPFPLLARAPQVEAAINSDSTYGCTITFDNGGAKTGKATPTQGCCGNSVKVWTGTAAVGGSAALFNTAAHLEPNSSPSVGTLCAQPGY